MREAHEVPLRKLTPDPLAPTFDLDAPTHLRPGATNRYGLINFDQRIDPQLLVKPDATS